MHYPHYFGHNDPAAFAYFQQELMSPRLQEALLETGQQAPFGSANAATLGQYPSQPTRYDPTRQHESLQQQQQPQQHRPSIMVPPQSPTLASYYFEGSNGWVNHYYDPRRRQYLSSRVNPDFHQRYAQQPRQVHSNVLPSLDSLNYSQQLQLQQQQQQQQQHQKEQLQHPSGHQHQHPQQHQQQQQQQHVLSIQQPYSSSQTMLSSNNIASHYNMQLPPRHPTYQQNIGPDFDARVPLQSFSIPSGPVSIHNNPLVQQSLSNDTIPDVYFPAVVNAPATTNISQPAMFNPTLASMGKMEFTEELRESMLQYAHTLYASSPQNPTLLSLLHSIHAAFPTHLPTLLLLACVYYSYQDYQSSLRYNHLILKYEPVYVEAMSNIGTTLRSMGRTREAERWWYQAVKLRPGYWDAVENLVGVLCSSTPTVNSIEQHLKNTTLDTKHEKTQDHGQQQPSPRYKEALSVCEFVEQYYFKSQTDALLHGPIKAPKQLPTNQLPRLQNLFYAKGNLKYALSDIAGARREYEKGLELAFGGINLLTVINHIALACGSTAVMEAMRFGRTLDSASLPLILLQPDQAVRILQITFSSTAGVLPGFAAISQTTVGNDGTTGSSVLHQANQTTSTILLTLAKQFQDMMNPSTPALAAAASSDKSFIPTLSLLLPLYYMSLALHPSPSTANNLGIIISNISGAAAATAVKLPTMGPQQQQQQQPLTGTMLAMQYYMYGLQIDPRHPHLYTNLGSLLKDMGHLNEAVSMYEKAVEYNPRFDVALANLGNAIKDMGRVQDSVQWYRRAVEVNPNFVDAICGLVNSLGGVCDWRGRGGVGDEPTVDQYGKYFPSTGDKHARSGWIGRVVDTVEKQLDEGSVWGAGILKLPVDANGMTFGEILTERISSLVQQASPDQLDVWRRRLNHYHKVGNKKNEGGWIIRLLERIMRRLQRNWYLELYGAVLQSKESQPKAFVTAEAIQKYQRPLIPSNLAAPPVPTVLPFHTFTYPLSARQVRLISHRNALRISHTTLTSSWVASHVYPPPPPPSPRLKIGYISSDFNNHPLSHLMQSVFGFHDRERCEVFCYATTPSDNTPYRLKIEREAEHFIDVSSWSNQQIIEKVVEEGIHVLVNLNGYTKGARNEIFAARPSPVQCSFMGFAGTLGGGWCDWIIADAIVCPPEMTSCEVWRSRQSSGTTTTLANGDFEGDIDPEEDTDDFVYTEKFIYMPHSYFVNDHKQGFRETDANHSSQNLLSFGSSTVDTADIDSLWAIEEEKRWKMRREVFPNLSDDVVIFANFNQLYKLEPSTFRMWLRILERVPNSILWLLRFPPAGEQHLRRCALDWAGPQVAQRVIFTDVAPKHIHIYRGRVADLFLDTPECNAHTTAADILWSGTPIVTYPKYMHKMCSRVGASIARATGYGDEMIVSNEKEYEDRAVSLAQGLVYTYETVMPGKVQRRGQGDLMNLRKRLFCTREKSRLFDTHRWTRNLEHGYFEAWRRWVTGDEFEDMQSKPSSSGCIWVVDPDD
ncbi:glycosyl transferase family 41-domain-containing protein [Radiomyces spectabilis]|uniref:glycosyl transferase family 41-domain-containing protein n=1 Tax=Radiomyces spectabilis TaxID=64574 RepID=UPI00221E844B|nr:glycosyl transferase family 41-domain-containing protein [Radiomyces spectabilis]KAI8377621.1 glycosyl transferase family 41-domain-containing protein [Radiomyces spectabilis]